MRAPEEYVVSRMCREFGGYPHQAIRAYRRDPDLIERILELRDYERAFQAVRAAEKPEDLPPEGTSVLIDTAWEMFATGGRGRPA